MSLALLVPLALAALAAWIVPLVVHLVRRPEDTPTPFAALRWIRGRTRPRRRLRWQDLPLLATRLLLLALVALLLARPVLDGDPRLARPHVFVAPGVEVAAARAVAASEKATWSWLADGFPAFEDEAPAAGSDVASLLREADAGLPAGTAMTVVVPAQLDGLDGGALTLSRTVDWRVVDTAASQTTVAVEAASTKRRLALRRTAGDSQGARVVRAAVAAWNSGVPDAVVLDEQAPGAPIPTTADALVWLDDAPDAAAKAWIEAGGRALVVGPGTTQGRVLARDDDGALVREFAEGSGTRLALVRAFEPQAIPQLLDASFARDLHDWLFTAADATPRRGDATAVAPTTGAAAGTPWRLPLDPWIGVAIAAVFLVERVLATRRRREAA